MGPTSVEFFLAPDAASTRQIRRHIAETAPGLYRIAGTWPELLAQAEACYLMPPTPLNWSPKLMQAASGQEGGVLVIEPEGRPRGDHCRVRCNSASSI